jgi:type IV pilus assembly protein PilV
MRAGEARRARGMSLIEVLVSMVIVSVGALSATSLQIVTKRTNRDAAQRLEATHLASSVIERMRANNAPAALATYAALGQYTTAAPRPMGGRVLAEALAPSCSVDANLCCPEGTQCCLPGTTCGPEQIATVELFQLEWVMDGVMEQASGVDAGGLDAPTTCIQGPAVPGDDGFYTVTVAFRGSLAIAEDPAVSCGHDARDTVSGDKLYGENNEFRRTLTVSAFIAPSVPK